MAEVSDDIVYHVYANDQANTQLASFSMTPPSDEQRWWAYAPDHQDVYVVTTGDDTKLLKWTVGDDMPHEAPHLREDWDPRSASSGTSASTRAR